MLMTLSIDTSRIDDKITVLTSELKSRFPDGIPERVDSELSRLTNDIIFTDLSSTVGADGTREIVQRVDFGGCFDSFTSALRAGDFDVHGDPLKVV
ncbi:TPA: hypothetical protein RRV19_003621 [Klebsiella pneumoniae]|uniref:hypothetical protein n=1 Tax=Klebsiella TaxID=570 RepID=UPI00103483C9|nr:MULTISPECIES: hypothetical protein [Klebsiella]HDT5552657.1 hypothetical protein [Klebsiella pneumoniae subsp. ozaenae]MBZ1725944.1 hypothetical protein [Klebsiella pneumoniae]MCB3541521.1 hypothetical protein [Klebsiella pneumoniae]VGC07752.1 regulatory protein [Klebsiella pneumoniae]VGC40448.1 regulatory protein [Klebsiella pneumoniae]